LQQRGELEVAALDRAEAHLVADAQHQRDDAPGVLAARVGVLGLERLAHQQRCPAVGLRERDGAIALRRRSGRLADRRRVRRSAQDGLKRFRTRSAFFCAGFTTA
jgi:hypothetical protein